MLHRLIAPTAFSPSLSLRVLYVVINTAKIAIAHVKFSHRANKVPFYRNPTRHEEEFFPMFARARTREMLCAALRAVFFSLSLFISPSPTLARLFFRNYEILMATRITH